MKIDLGSSGPLGHDKHRLWLFHLAFRGYMRRCFDSFLVVVLYLLQNDVLCLFYIDFVLEFTFSFAETSDFSLVLDANGSFCDYIFQFPDARFKELDLFCPILVQLCQFAQ